MREQHILFVNMPTIPLADIFNETTSRVVKAFPFGILYLSASIKQAGHHGKIACADYAVVDHSGLRMNFDETICALAMSAMRPHTPDVLAFSFSYSPSWEFFDRSLHILKRIWSEAKVIVGGMHASNTIEHLLENHDQLVDFVVAGEAENALPRLLRAITNGDDVSHICGVHTRGAIQRDAHGQIAIASCMETDVNDLPFPDWDILDMDIYTGKTAHSSHIFWDVLNTNEGGDLDASLFTSRGCPYKCTFCASNTIHGRKMRVRSPQNVASEMCLLNERYGVNHFHIYDDLPLITKKRTHELLGAMRGSGISNLKISFTQTLYINTTTEEMIDAIVESTGGNAVSFAVESGSPKIQKLIGKNVHLDKAARLIRYAQSRGLFANINIILGFPGETVEDMQETINFVHEHLKPSWTLFHIATPIVGTVMYQQFLEAGCIVDGPETWKRTLTNNRFFDSPWISANDLNELRYRANLECNFIHNHEMQAGNYSNAVRLFDSVLKIYPFHVYALDGIRRATALAGDSCGARAIEESMKTLVHDDSRAQELLEKYGDLFPDVVRITTA